MTAPDGADHGWRFCRFYLLVTGKGEHEFLPQLLRAVAADGHCAFVAQRRLAQRSPLGPKARLDMRRSGKLIPEKDVDDIGVPTRRWLREPNSYVLLVDDLEWDSREQAGAKFERYRLALDSVLPDATTRARASVHFLVMMLEAYYLADPAAVNAVLGTSLAEPERDVETIRHPKNDLKRLVRGFDEIEHGRQIVARLDLDKVLSDPSACRALRTLVKWCVKAKGGEFTERFQLANGELWDVTRGQIDALPS